MFPAIETRRNVSLPFDLKEEELAARNRDLEETRRQYEFTVDDGYDGFPQTIKNLAGVECQEDFNVWQDTAFQGDLNYVRLAMKYSGLITETYNPWDDLEDFDTIFAAFRFYKPKSAAFWREDEEFGRQWLEGVNPLAIQRIRSIPKDFAFNLNRVNHFLGSDLYNELKQGRILYVSVPDLDGIEPVVGRMVFSPHVLFHWKNDTKKLMPIAIQLTQKPNRLGTFYPDENFAWLFAKIASSSADAIYHQIVNHLMLSHLVAETEIIATRRNIHKTHIVHQLLDPHFHSTMGINVRAKEFLIPIIIAKYSSLDLKGTIEVGRRAFAHWNFSENSFPKVDLSKRGMWEPEFPDQEIPFPYRDQGLQIWDDTYNYVISMLTNYYVSRPVKDDPEIRHWALELSQKLRGFPTEIPDITKLAEVVTAIMFGCSAQHSAVSAMQYEYYSYVPNKPLFLFGNSSGLPSDRNLYDNSMIFGLFQFRNAAIQAASTWTLSIYDTKDNMLSRELWVDSKAQEIEDDFRLKMSKMSDRIREENSKKEEHRKYWAMDPRVIPRSIEI